jgi:hypothetical protein
VETGLPDRRSGIADSPAIGVDVGDHLGAAPSMRTSGRGWSAGRSGIRRMDRGDGAEAVILRHWKAQPARAAPRRARSMRSRLFGAARNTPFAMKFCGSWRRWRSSNTAFMRGLRGSANRWRAASRADRNGSRAGHRRRAPSDCRHRPSAAEARAPGILRPSSRPLPAIAGRGRPARFGRDPEIGHINPGAAAHGREHRREQRDADVLPSCPAISASKTGARPKARAIAASRPARCGSPSRRQPPERASRRSTASSTARLMDDVVMAQRPWSAALEPSMARASSGVATRRPRRSTISRMRITCSALERASRPLRCRDCLPARRGHARPSSPPSPRQRHLLAAGGKHREHVVVAEQPVRGALHVPGAPARR